MANPDPLSYAESQLSPKLLAMLRACPTTGAGVHNYLIKVAVRLHHYFTDKEIIIALLEHYSANCGRDVPYDEIAQAVDSSAAWIKSNQSKSENPTRFVGEPRWPVRSQESIDKLPKKSLSDLQSSSPVKWTDDVPHTEEVIDVLFPGDPLLCAGPRTQIANTRSRSLWRGTMSEQQFIVANPMLVVYGKTKQGKQSMRCLANVGPRRFVVIECDCPKWETLSESDKLKFDTEENYRSAKRDEQASILSYLAQYAPLTMVVDSGGKSLHGWFFCSGQTEELVERFMRLAVSLGADPATWTRCQFVRMPDGLRDNGRRQKILYFNPSTIK